MAEFHSDEFKARVVDLYTNTNMSAREIGASLQVSKSVVIGVVHRAGIKRRERMSEERKRLVQRAGELRLAGYSLRQMSEVLGVPSGTLASWCANMPMPERTKKVRTYVTSRKKFKPQEPGRIEHPDQMELPLEPEQPVQEPDTIERTTIHELKTFQCRDVVFSDDQPGGLYCPRDAVKGSYCRAHAMRYFEKRVRPPRGRRAPVYDPRNAARFAAE